MISWEFNDTRKMFEFKCSECGYGWAESGESRTGRDGTEEYVITSYGGRRRCPNCEWHDHKWVPLGIEDGKMTLACSCGFFKRVEAKEIKR